MWYTYDQRIYIYVCIHTDIWVMRTWSRTVMFLDVLAEFYDPMNPFSVSSETSSKCCWGHVHRPWHESTSTIQVNHNLIFTSPYSNVIWFHVHDLSLFQVFRPYTSPTLLHQVMPTFSWRIKWCIIIFTNLVPSQFFFSNITPVSSNNGTTTSTTWSSSPFCSNSSYPTWIGPGSRNHMSSRWP